LGERELRGEYEGWEERRLKRGPEVGCWVVWRQQITRGENEGWEESRMRGKQRLGGQEKEGIA